MEHLKSYQRTIDSVRLPIEHFAETGFWNPYAIPGSEDHDISEAQVRRACRQVAKEAKRPFIQCFALVNLREWDRASNKWTPLPEPRFAHGFVEVPKRKYLYPLVAPLMLAAPTSEGRWPRMHSDVVNCTCDTLWAFRVFNEQLWNQYYDYVLNDPECRAARKLTA